MNISSFKNIDSINIQKSVTGRLKGFANEYRIFRNDKIYKVQGGNQVSKTLFSSSKELLGQIH